MEAKPKLILVIHLAGIGDLLMGRWALECLRRQFPGARIVLLTWRKNLEAAELINSVDERFGLSSQSSPGVCVGNLRLLMRLRQRHFDLAINAYQVYRYFGVLKLAVLLAMVGARETAGRDTDGKGWCFNRRIKESLSDRVHEVRRQLHLVECLGCAAVPAPALPRPSSEDGRIADQWLNQNGIALNAPFAVIHPGGARTGHRWPADSFAKLASLLEKEDNLRIVITGAETERGLAEKIALSLKRPAIAAGELAFGQLAHLLRRCRIFISNDSGPAHLAAALCVPMVVIFGPGDPAWYGPYPLDRTDQIILHATGDPVCFKHRCATHLPLQKLSVDHVLKRARDILGAKHPSGIEQVPAA